MKKVLVSILLAGSTASHAEAPKTVPSYQHPQKTILDVTPHAVTPFNGFYFGLFTGYGSRNVETEVNWERDNSTHVITTSYLNSKSNSGLLYGLCFGVGNVVNKLYFGAEVSLHHDTTSESQGHKIGVNALDKSSGTLGILQVNTKTKYSRGPVLSLTPRVGIMLKPDTLCYLRLGIEGSRDKLQTLTNFLGPNSYSSSSKTKISLAPGVGIEQSFGNTALRLEYSYNFGSKIKEIDDDNIHLQSKFNQHNLKVGLIFNL
jgi:hypothetical protein